MKKTPATPPIKFEDRFEQQPVKPPLSVFVLQTIVVAANDELKDYLKSRRTDKPVVAARLVTLAHSLQSSVLTMPRDNDTLRWYEAKDLVDEARYTLETIAALRSDVPDDSCAQRREDLRIAREDIARSAGAA